MSYFFAERLPYVPSVKPKVFQAYASLSNLGEDEGAKSLKSGMLPLVRLVDRPGTYGFTPAGETVIELEKTFIKELEAALPLKQLPTGRKSHSPTELEVRALILLESTVLHELVHYFRYKTMDSARIRASSLRGRSYEEAVADSFENEAYGFQPGVRNMLLERHLPKTAAYMASGH